MKAKLVLLFTALTLVFSSCKKDDCPKPEEQKVYLVMYEFSFTGSTGSNQVTYINNAGVTVDEFNVPNYFTYYRAGVTGDNVSMTGLINDGTSCLVKIYLDDTVWKQAIIQNGQTFPYSVTASGVLP